MEVCIMYGFLSYTNLFQSAPNTLQDKQHDFIMYSSEMSLSSLQHTENQGKCPTMVLQNKCAASRHQSSWRKVCTWQKRCQNICSDISPPKASAHWAGPGCEGNKHRLQVLAGLIPNGQCEKKHKWWFSDLCVSELTAVLQRPLKLV